MRALRALDEGTELLVVWQNGRKIMTIKDRQKQSDDNVKRLALKESKR